MKNFGEGVTGFITDAQFIKTKSNAKGSIVQLVYTEKMSYDPFLSTAYFAMQTGDIKKVGNNYVLDDYPDHKFNIKNIQEVFAENPVLIPAFYDQMVKKLTKYLGSYELGQSETTDNDYNDGQEPYDPLADIELF